ncbi:hypothetical protein RP20_CCG012250 [Aedes albopictus]|nr:hypothetical protein RP20_CCG012250 [Aedes albopictus]
MLAKSTILLLTIFFTAGTCFPPPLAMLLSLSPQQRQQFVKLIDDSLAKSELRNDPQIKAMRSLMGSFVDDTSAKNVDLNSLLRLLGVGLNLGGLNVGFAGPEVSVNSPLGRIGCGFLREPASGNNGQRPGGPFGSNSNNGVGGEDEVDDLRRLG